VPTCSFYPQSSNSGHGINNRCFAYTPSCYHMIVTVNVDVVMCKCNEAIVDITLRIRPISHVPYGPLRANMTSSTKPEVHNILHCRQRRTEQRPQLTCRENSLKFVCGFWNTRADRQTDRHTDTRTAHRNTSHRYRRPT